MKKRFTQEQVIGFLREADAGMALKDLCRKYGFSQASYYGWKAKFGSMSVPDAKRLKELEAENNKLKKLLANSMLEVDAMREVLRGSRGRGGQTRGRAVAVPARPEPEASLSTAGHLQ